MIYDFLISRGSNSVQNNLAFMRKNLELTSLQDEMLLLQNCIKIFIEQSKEEIEDQVKTLLGRIVTFTAPLDNVVTYRTISDMVCSLRFFGYELMLIKREDLVEDYPLDDGIAMCYLLDLKKTIISGIYSGIGREFEDQKYPVNVTDSVMTWIMTGDIAFSSDIEQITFIEQRKNDYANMKHRGMSLDYDGGAFYDVLMGLQQRPVLITNILPDEFSSSLTEEN